MPARRSTAEGTATRPEEGATERHARLAEVRPRQVLLAGAAGACVGLAMVGTGVSDVGPWVVLASLVTLIYGVHASGRIGPG